MIKTVSLGNETFNYCDHEVVLPRSAIGPMLKTIDLWCKSPLKEPTYAMEKWGVPSIAVRFDGTLEGDDFRSYEIQGGCSWMGYSGLANEAFRKIRDDLAKNAWPPFKLLATSPDRKIWDDSLWLESFGLQEALRGSGPLFHSRLFFELPREQRMSLIRRSLMPVYDAHNKQYGVDFGWWKYVFWDDAEKTLPWDEPFVLKPMRNSGSYQIMIWKPDDRRGRATRTQILKVLAERVAMFLQPYIPPMRTTLNGKEYNMILRPYFGFDPRTKEWVPMHGVWTARPAPNLRIHGSSDAISGPLMVR